MLFRSNKMYLVISAFFVVLVHGQRSPYAGLINTQRFRPASLTNSQVGTQDLASLNVDPVPFRSSINQITDKTSSIQPDRNHERSAIPFHPHEAVHTTTKPPFNDDFEMDSYSFEFDFYDYQLR